MKIGFVGLGQMGKPMAINMLKSGAALSVFAADKSSYAEFERVGATTASELGALAAADVVFLSLPHAQAVHEVLLGEHGLAKAMKPGQIVVDTSTAAYNATIEIAAALEQLGIHFVDAPVSGMEARAVDGTLTAMCGGAASIVEKVRPYLACVANNIMYMGPAGSGQLSKLINQLLFDINCAALAEILPMAAKLGLDPEKIGKIVNTGTGRSYASEFFIPRILQNDFSAGYPMSHAYKDLVSAAELGANEGIPMPVLAAATATYQMALLKGYGEFDKGAMIHVFEDLTGARFRHASAHGEAKSVAHR
jgi:3-hydroxyisobutyrate dehydrogenase-like beta-hydroxyacid dehydrogenase